MLFRSLFIEDSWNVRFFKFFEPIHMSCMTAQTTIFHELYEFHALSTNYTFLYDWKNSRQLRLKLDSIKYSEKFVLDEEYLQCFILWGHSTITSAQNHLFWPPLPPCHHLSKFNPPSRPLVTVYVTTVYIIWFDP